MSRVAKLAMACALGGILLAVALVTSVRPPPGPAIDPAIVEIDDTVDPLESELRRCRTVTEADAACNAVWEAQSRRFFHSKD